MQELTQKCLNFSRPLAMEALAEGMSSSSPQTTKLQVLVPTEELAGVIKKMPDGYDNINHHERRTLLKVFSKMIDGSTLSFAELSKRIEEGLKNAGVTFHSEDLEVGMMILDSMAGKQNAFSGQAPQSVKNPHNLTFFEIRGLESYKTEEEFDQMWDRQCLRRHIIILLGALQKYLHNLESESGDYQARIEAIDEAERKYSEAKSRLTSELLRLERKAQNPRGSFGATSIAKQPKLDQPAFVKASSSVIESGQKNFNTDTQGASSSGIQSNQQNVQQLNKVGVLTSFFGPRKEHKVCQEPVKPAQERNLFRSLGAHPFLGGSWTDIQASDFQDHLDRRKPTPSTKELWQDLILSTKSRKNQQKKNDMILLQAREKVVGMDSSSPGPIGQHLDGTSRPARGPLTRFIFMKLEDHLLNTLGHSGIFRPSAEAKPEVCFKMARDPLYKIPGIEYDLSDSDEEAEDAESIGSKDEEDEDMSNPSLDDEEKDDFIVPDGYLSDDEMMDKNDQAERNLQMQKKPKKRKFEKLEMKIRNLIEDPASGAAYTAMPIGWTSESQTPDQGGMESQQLGCRELTFPLKCTEPATEQDELNDEVIKDLLKELHCSANKGVVITKIGEKYKYVSKSEIKLRVDESSVQAIVIDPLIYKKAGLGPQKYLTDLGRMFTPELHGTEHRLVHALDEIALNLSDTRLKGDVSEKDLLSIAISMNGLPGRTVVNAQTHLTYHFQNPGIKKVSIERKLKEVGACLFIVRRDVYETYFDGDKPRPTGDQLSQAIIAESSSADQEWEIQGEWFQSINRYFRSNDCHNLPNSSLQFGTQPVSDSLALVEASQRVMPAQNPAESGKSSLSSKNRQNNSVEASQGSFKNQDIRDLIKGSSAGSAFEHSNPEDSRTRQFVRPKTPLEKSFANVKENQAHSQGALPPGSNLARAATKPAELHVSKKTTGVARSKASASQGLPGLGLDRQEPMPEEQEDYLNQKPTRPEPQIPVPNSPRDRGARVKDFKVPSQIVNNHSRGMGALDVENSSEEVQLGRPESGITARSPQSLSEVEEVEICPSRISPERPPILHPPQASSPVSQAGSMTSAHLAMYAGIKPSGADKSFANLIDLEEDDPDAASISGQSGIVAESTNRIPLLTGSTKTVPNPFNKQPENSRLQHTTTVDSMPAINLAKLMEERNKKGQEEIKSRPKAQLKENRGAATKMDIEKAPKKHNSIVPETQITGNSQTKVMMMFRMPNVDEGSMTRNSNVLSVGLPSQREIMKNPTGGPGTSKSDPQQKPNVGSKNDPVPSKNHPIPLAAAGQPTKQLESPSRKMQLVERRSGSTSLKRSDEPVPPKPVNALLQLVSQSKPTKDKALPKQDELAAKQNHEVVMENLNNSLNKLVRSSRSPSPDKRPSEQPPAENKKPKATKPGSKLTASLAQFVMRFPDESNSGQSGVIQISDEGKGPQGAVEQGNAKQPASKAKQTTKNQGSTKAVEDPKPAANPSVTSQRAVKVPDPAGKPQKSPSSDDEDANSSSRGPLTRSRASKTKDESKPKEETKKGKKASKN